MKSSTQWPFSLRALLLATLILAVGGALFFHFWQPRPSVIRLAAGSVGSESHDLGLAIRDTLASHGRGRVDVVATAGSSASMAALDAGEVDVILTQADVRPSPKARTVLRAFPENFQLVVRTESGIRLVSDLRGKRLGLASKGSGQYSSFWFLAAHYDLTPGDLVEVTASEEEIDRLFLAGEIDAVFRVRPPRNQGVERLVRQGGGTLVPIDQGGAIVLKQPALEISLIPKGAYQGAPPIPEIDLATVSSPRLMMARADFRPSAIRGFVEAVFDLRHDLGERMPLATFIAPPDESRPSLVPVHEGARLYFEREKPNFLQENADYIALILTVVVGLGSWLWGVKRRLENANKERADRHNAELSELMGLSQTAQTFEEIDLGRSKLVTIFQQVVRELDNGKIDTESVQSFALVWNATANLLRDREAALRRG